MKQAKDHMTILLRQRSSLHSDCYRPTSLQSSRSDSRSVRQGVGMDDDGLVIARRLAFLERELDRMGEERKSVV